MEEFLRSIPAAAGSPYAFAAYGIAVVLFVVGYSRHRWMLSLVGGLAIAILTVCAVAVLRPAPAPRAAKPVEVVEETVPREQIDAWRQAHAFGHISGAARIVIDLPQNERPQELDPWLGRVSKRYQELRRKGAKLPREALGDKPGNEYVEIRPFTHPVLNADLEPRGEAERYADLLLFNSYYFVIASRDVSKPQAPCVSVQTMSEYVKVFFDGAQKPYRIESSVAGRGNFNPVADHFTHWLDFYGANLTVRVRATGASPQMLSLAKIDRFSFTTRSDAWQATARFGAASGVGAVVNHPGSLTIVAADWKTLGPVPGDFPGKRLPSYGPAPKPGETPAVRP